jgi:tetratricopeptide (TPR) repeat protein
MTKRVREYLDKDHEVMDDYYGLCESYNGRNAKTVKKQLRGLIEKDPDFFDSYLLLYEILQDEGKFTGAERILDEAFYRAEKLITDENGQWPDRLEWGWLGNRHIIRTIVNKALLLWEQDTTDIALDLLRKLLLTNPNDNPGVRYFILGIQMNMTHTEFEEKFDRGGFYDSDINTWFTQNDDKFPEEFDWWEKAIEEEE